MALDGFEGVLGWVWDVLGWLLDGLWDNLWGWSRMVLRLFWHGFQGFGMGLGCFGMVLGRCCAWLWDVAGLFFDCVWGSRSPVAEKVEEPEPTRATERTTGRAVWVGLGVFWLACWIAFVGLV